MECRGKATSIVLGEMDTLIRSGYDGETLDISKRFEPIDKGDDSHFWIDGRNEIFEILFDFDEIYFCNLSKFQETF